jgi:PAS domain S-box/diguanylate cyclase (GGDEF) domain
VENETRMRHLFEQAPMGLVLLGTNGRIVDCNPTFLDMMGAPREKAIGFNMVADAKDASLAPSIRRALTGERTTLECPYTSTLGDKTGDYRYLFQPIVLRGAITGALVFVEDISERKGAERELLRAHDELEARVASRTRQLAETNQRLETLVVEREKAGNELREKLHFIQVLLDAIPNPVFYKDRQGRYLGCNQAFASVLGLKEEQIVGKTLHDVAPKERADRYQEMDEALFSHPPYQVHEESVAVNGEERSILFNKATFNDAEGNVAGLVGIMVDLTERKREQEKLAEAEAMFRSLVEQSLVGIYIIQDGVLAYVNPRLADIFGYPAEDMLGLAPFDLIDETDHQRLTDNLRSREEGQIGTSRTLYLARRRDGSHIEIEAHSRRTEYRGKPALIGLLLDATEQQAAERQLNYLAFYDVLTGQPNRTLFLDHLRLAMAGAKRRGALMALHFLDLDRFKEINDTLGHHTGDLLLKSVAQRLQECVGDTDTVARLGGDEFAVIQTDLPGIEGAEMMAQKIIDTIVQPFTLEGHEVYTSTSIGITVYPLEDANPDQLLKNADMAMYAAKNQGRNNFQFFSGTMNVEAHSRMKLQAGLRQALEHDELLLYYQPKVSLETGLVVGAEALLRWRAADGKLIPPTTSSRWRKNPASSSPSASGCWKPPAARTWLGSRRTWRPCGYRSTCPRCSSSATT